MKNHKWLHVLFTITFLLIFGTDAHSQMLADITEPVETDFGTYRPYHAVFSPRVPVFSVEPDFTNVSNFSDITGRKTFSSQDSLLLSTNYFTVKKTRFTKM